MQQVTLFRVDYVDHAGRASRAYVRVRPTIADDNTGRTVYYAVHGRLGCGKNRGTPDAAAIALVNDHGRVTDCAAMPLRLADLREQCSMAFQQALAEAHREYKHGLLRSRGRWVVITSRTGDAVVASGDWEWTGDKAQMHAVMAYAANLDIDTIRIEGGVNHADYLAGFDNCDYEPWVAEWSVSLYSSDVELLEVSQ